MPKTVFPLRCMILVNPVFYSLSPSSRPRSSVLSARQSERPHMFIMNKIHCMKIKHKMMSVNKGTWRHVAACARCDVSVSPPVWLRHAKLHWGRSSRARCCVGVWRRWTLLPRSVDVVVTHAVMSVDDVMSWCSLTHSLRRQWRHRVLPRGWGLSGHAHTGVIHTAVWHHHVMRVTGDEHSLRVAVSTVEVSAWHTCSRRYNRFVLRKAWILILILYQQRYTTTTCLPVRLVCISIFRKITVTYLRACTPFGCPTPWGRPRRDEPDRPCVTGQSWAALSAVGR